jgi:UDP-N-acetylmuramate dehydrogenase
VIKNLTDKIEVLSSKKELMSSPQIAPRFDSLEKVNQKILKDHDYNLADFPPIWVSLDSGVTLPKAIFYLIGQGITGLEWFAGIPSTVGGASFINLHGGDKYWSDYLVSAEIVDSQGKKRKVKADYFGYDYDHSEIKKSGDIVLTVTLKLCYGPQEKALAIAKSWALKKSHQPQRSSGCIFQNLDADTQQKLNLPTPSIGYLMDNVLQLKGKAIGQARVAEKHAGFIENLGEAKAADVYKLIKLMKQKAKKELNLKLKLEIVPMGFSKEEMQWLD